MPSSQGILAWVLSKIPLPWFMGILAMLWAASISLTILIMSDRCTDRMLDRQEATHQEILLELKEDFKAAILDMESRLQREADGKQRVERVIVEVPKYVQDNRACDVPRDVVGMLNALDPKGPVHSSTGSGD